MGPLVRSDFSPSSLLNSVRAIFSIRSNDSSERACQSESNNLQNDSNANSKNEGVISDAAATVRELDDNRYSGSSSLGPPKVNTTLSVDVDREDIVAFGGSTDAYPLQSREHADV